MPANTQIPATGLPSGTGPEMDFLESSFFKNNRLRQCLPTLAEVRALSGTGQSMSQPPPMKFEHLNLIVKFGPHVSIGEALCLWAIESVLSDEVPVPEVYGWRVDGRDTFIYMQLVQGETLMDRWHSLNAADKTAICDHLRQIMMSLRQVEQNPHDSFIGMLWDRKAIIDND
jgi:hypothetical protein